jgi:hypothetical protein
MWMDDENDYEEKRRKRLSKLDQRLEAARRQIADREAFLERTVPVFTRLLDEAFAQAGLVKSKAMTTLVQEIILTESHPSVERTMEIIRDFGKFSREAGLGPEPLRERRR